MKGRQLNLNFPEPVVYIKEQIYLFGEKVTQEERQRAIEEAQEDAKEIKEHDEFLSSGS